MSGLISIYLDIWRFVATLGVFETHVRQHSAAQGMIPFIYFDHKLVIFFFVISGFVIAASASRPDRTLANYSADRLARLSSVVIPALILTGVLDFVGGHMSPQVYEHIDPNKQPMRYLVNFFYLQQVWTLCVNPGTNTPLWSLGYEFWYYVLFGIWVFVRTWGMKALWLLAGCLIVGPKILLLAPGWIVGAVAYYVSKRARCAYIPALILFILSFCAIIAAMIWVKELRLSNFTAGEPPLYYSSEFIGDNIFATLVAINFVCCAMFSKHVKVNFEPYRAVKIIRWLATHTFSLYVFHMPILYAIRAIGKYNINSYFQVGIAATLALIIIFALSTITEERLPALRGFLRMRFTALAGKLRPAAVK